MKKLFAILLTAIMLLVMPGCKKGEDVDIYASIYPVYLMASEIVQDKLVVKQVYPAGADIHEYDPGNGKEMVRMSKAKVIFYIGSGLEGFIEKSHNVFDKTGVELVELSRAVRLCKQTNNGYDYLTFDESTVARGVADLHIWLDPLRMVEMSKVVLETVIKIDPANEAFYTENANNLIKRFIELDDLFKETLSNEEINKIILVDHDAYLYWEERYGVKRIRIRRDNESCDTVLSDVPAIVKKAKENGIKYIITTKNENVCEIVKKYAKELGAEIIELNSVSTLYKSDIESKRDYFTIMNDNLTLLLKALPKVEKK